MPDLLIFTGSAAAKTPVAIKIDNKEEIMLTFIINTLA
jgi:hypothetical protein